MLISLRKFLQTSISSAAYHKKQPNKEQNTCGSKKRRTNG